MIGRANKRVLRDSLRAGLVARPSRLLAALVAAIFLVPTPANGIELKPETAAAFDHYVQLTEARIDAELARGTPFLWVDSLPEDRRAAAEKTLHDGGVVIERLETREEGKPIAVPDGLIHHWIGTIFIPGVTLPQTLALLQDYDRHQIVFKPDVMRSKILSHDGNDFTVFFRFYYKRVLTAVVDTENQIRYTLVDPTHAWSRSHSVHVREVENPGESNERQLPEGGDRGLLWRMDADWRFEQKDGGTYVECQSISLTRASPYGLGWLIGPFVERIPRESLTFTLTAARAALERSATTTSAR